MKEERYQQELFEFERPKRRFQRLINIFPKIDLENKFAITLSSERIVFISIGVIMAMVIIYALGVETGKSLNLAKMQPVVKSVLRQETARRYTIVCGSYTRKEYALQELNRLKKENFEAYLSQAGPYTHVCVGIYASKENVKSDLDRIKKKYQGAFVKLR